VAYVPPHGIAPSTNGATTSCAGQFRKYVEMRLFSWRVQLDLYMHLTIDSIRGNVVTAIKRNPWEEDPGASIDCSNPFIFRSE
jgi:hypothetical protein